MKVFYNEKQSVEDGINDSFSPSASKPKKVVDNWVKSGFPIQIVDPTPATVEQISLAHSRKLVEGILNLKLNNGFSNRFPEIAESLPWTSGSFTSAALYAVETGETVASPTSGFHHASYNNASAFCTFNGLMVAFQVLRNKGYNKKIGIIDCDAHYGNGTDEIISNLGLAGVEHYTFGAYSIYPENSRQWLTRDFPRVLESFADCGVIFYQAGADPHVDDPLGGHLTTEQMLQRDILVFQFAKKHKIPVVWNLAGGYQRDFDRVLEIHANTAMACMDIFEGTNFLNLSANIA